MTVSQAKLFRDIAQSRSFSRGASLNGISQSAASQHIHEMERRLGLSLFDRRTRPLSLTQAGKLYADFCRDVLRREEELQVEIEELKGASEGTVRVASIYSIGLSEMTRVQEEFATRFPGMELHVDYAQPAKIYEALLADHVDLGLVSYPEASKELAVIACSRKKRSSAWRIERSSSKPT